MNKRWKFGALFADDIKLITADLFAVTDQFMLSLHVYNIFSINQNNCKILVHLCVYTFVAQKLLLEAKVAFCASSNLKVA